MLLTLRRWLLGGGTPPATTDVATPSDAAPLTLESTGIDAPLDFAAILSATPDWPVPDWQQVQAWALSAPDPGLQGQAWSMAEKAWLAHMRLALGPHYRLTQHEQSLLLSCLEPNVADATVRFMTKTLARIERVLDGVAQPSPWGSDILIVFQDPETYYRYAARYYADDGEFALSSGMHIHFGCSHFIVQQDDLRLIEPVIAHEMTHGCLAHLAIPAWLNEGLAVNTEQRLRPPVASVHTPHELDGMHRRFWTEALIQEFWSGHSFLRPDEGNLLSYDLARMLTARMALDWERFRDFVLSADLADAGQSAARQSLGVDLGALVCALFDFGPAERWRPDPGRWDHEPERGAFQRTFLTQSPGLHRVPCGETTTCGLK